MSPVFDADPDDGDSGANKIWIGRPSQGSGFMFIYQ